MSGALKVENPTPGKFKLEVEEFLKSELSNCTLKLKLLPNHRVYGTIMWDGYWDMDDETRFTFTWDLLRSHFKDRSSFISLLYLVTEREVGEI